MNLFFFLFAAMSNGFLPAATYQTAPPTDTQQTTDNKIEIVQQDLLTDPNGTYTIKLDTTPLDREANDIQVHVTIHGKIIRTQEKLTDTEPIHRLQPIPLAATQNENNISEIQIPIRNNSQTSTGFYLPEQGTYPINISFKQRDIELATTSAALTTTPNTEQFENIGTTSLFARLHLETLEQSITLLEKHQDLPFTLLIPQNIHSAIQENPRYKETLQSHSVIPNIEANSNLAALTAIEQEDLFFKPRRNQIDELQELGLSVNTEILFLNQELTEKTLQTLVEQEITLHIQTTADVPSQDITTTQIDAITTFRNTPLPVDLQTSLAQTTNQLLQELLLTTKQERNIHLFDLTQEQTILSMQKFLELTTTHADIKKQIQPLSPPQQAPQTQLSEETDETFQDIANQLEETSEKLAIYNEIYRSGNPKPETYQSQFFAVLTHQEKNYKQELELLSRNLDKELSSVTIENQSFNLASQNAEIPIKVFNNTDTEKELLLIFKSENATISTDQQTVLLKPGENLLNISANIRSFGVSYIEIIAKTASGKSINAQAELKLRPALIPGLGTLLSTGAAASLILWWFINHRRRKQATTAPIKQPK